MSDIVFYTPTILPKACLFTMGISAKDGTNPIGHFGTGLKYAIAVVMRLGGNITVEVEGRKMIFRTEIEEVRGKNFNTIICREYINQLYVEQQMPMTTDYGKEWAPWMALRELYSNTVDESGEIWCEDNDAVAHLDENNLFVDDLPQRPRSKHGTYITVTCPELYEAWQLPERNTWLLDTANRTSVWENARIAVYLQSSDTLFYRGIRVSAPGFSSALTYNIKKHTILTEDRTMDSWDFKYLYSADLLRMTASDAARKLLEASGNSQQVESGLYLAAIGTDQASTQMQETAIEFYRTNPNMISDTARQGIAKYMKEHNFDEIYVPVPLTPDQQQKMTHCLRVIEGAGIPLHKYKIHFCDNIGTTMGIAYRRTKTIILNTTLTLDVEEWRRATCTTLIEEFIHLEYDVSDYTREFQDRTINMIYDLLA